VNLRTPILLSHALAPRMVERGRGQLVFISSLAGKAAMAGASMYSATKFGLRGFALSLRSDLHGTGVGVTVVFPGFISEAGMFAVSGAKLPPGVGMKRPEDVAAAVVRAIEHDPAEIDVAPLPLRAGAIFSGAAPALADRVARRIGGTDVAEQLAEGQRDMR
jgi:short-subunit dehydrogenase